MIRVICKCGETLDPLKDQELSLEINLSQECIFVSCKKCKNEHVIKLSNDNNRSPLPKMKMIR
jgi:RNase P subunit RPR2